MIVTSTLTADAATTIPEAVRDVLLLRPGDELRYVIEGDRVVLQRSTSADLRDDPFRVFDEWDTEADRRAYAALSAG